MFVVVASSGVCSWKGCTIIKPTYPFPIKWYIFLSHELYALLRILIAGTVETLGSDLPDTHSYAKATREEGSQVMLKQPCHS